MNLVSGFVVWWRCCLLNFFIWSAFAFFFYMAAYLTIVKFYKKKNNQIGNGKNHNAMHLKAQCIYTLIRAKLYNVIRCHMHYFGCVTSQTANLRSPIVHSVISYFILNMRRIRGLEWNLKETYGELGKRI